MGHAEIATGRVNQGLTHLEVAVHVGLAMDHAKQAVNHGGMGHAPLVVTHAEMALTHARAAAELSDSPHLGLAIQGLEGAVNHGGMGHAEIATTSAQDGLNHLGM